MIKKNDAVVCINTTLRSSMPLTLYKKYNFTPIYIYLENKKPFVDYIAVYKEFKKKIPGLVVIRAPSLNPKDILPKLKKYNIIALMPYEESVVYADELASLLKIKGNDPKMTLIKKDKGMLNEYLEKKHIRVPKTLRSTSKNISLTQIDKFFKNKFPIIIKPVEGTGSIGVVCCNNKKEVEDALRLNNTLGSKFRVDKEMIYQECIKGTEYVVNFVSSNGKHVFTDCWKYHKYINNLGNSIYKMDEYVTNFNPEVLKCIEYCKKILDATNHKYGPTHFEVMYDKKGPVLIELNLRMFGGHNFLNNPVIDKYSTYELALLSYIDDAKILNKYLKEPLKYSNKETRVAYCLTAEKSFKYNLNPLPFFKKLKSYYESEFNYKIGDLVPKTTTLFELIGEVQLKNKNRKVVLGDIKKCEAWEKQYLS